MLVNNFCPITFSILLDGQNLLSLVTTLLAFSHFANKNYSLVLTTLQERSEEKEVCFSDLYLKGENLYHDSIVIVIIMMMMMMVMVIINYNDNNYNINNNDSNNDHRSFLSWCYSR